ncbi:MAG TPA: response regulator [Polyangia bacterium]|nr:response regulator [Polyangia bacterium]
MGAASLADSPNETAREIGSAPLLLVDDRVANLIALEAVLAPLGEQMVRATSGEEALRRVLEREFAVILMDVQMPGLDGIQTAELIKRRERSRRIPIIFLTAIHRDPSYVFRGYEKGAVDYLLKPFEPEILRSKVSVFIELFRKELEIRRQSARLAELERKAIERRHEQRFRAFNDSLPICMWAMDAGGRPYFVNRHWVELTGLDLVATTGDGIWQVVHEEDRAQLREAWDASVGRGEPMQLALRVRRGDGVWRWHQVSAVPERDERARVIGWIATATDIDDQKRAGEAAESANRTKDDFLAMVSHELRTPLNAILGWAEMLRSGRLPPDRVARALEVIVRNGRSQAQLIEDLLDVSRIVAGKLKIEREPLELQAIVAAAIDTVRPMALEKKIALEASVGCGQCELRGDAHRLQQVVWNLLSNAVKFSPPGSAVTVALDARGGEFVLRVRDSGMGIAREFLPHVFDRFRQAEGEAHGGRSGLGLGLAIAKHIVEQHGGAIAAESEGVGRGAEFTVRLPRSEVAAPAASVESELDLSGPITNTMATVPKPVEPPRLDGLRVLVVDDETDARDLVAEFLAQAGASVTAASGVPEALERVGAHEFDVLVSDLSMPQQDGYALLAALNERGIDLPSIAISAHVSTEDRGRALEAGFEMHLAKPFDERALIDLIARLPRDR